MWRGVVVWLGAYTYAQDPGNCGIGFRVQNVEGDGRTGVSCMVARGGVRVCLSVVTEGLLKARTCLDAGDKGFTGMGRGGYGRLGMISWEGPKWDP